MSDEKAFIRFINLEGTTVLELEAEKPQHLTRKLVENAEVIDNLRYDYHETNIRDFIKDEFT
jgi:hypothetical protein